MRDFSPRPIPQFRRHDRDLSGVHNQDGAEDNRPGARGQRGGGGGGTSKTVTIDSEWYHDFCVDGLLSADRERYAVATGVGRNGTEGRGNPSNGNGTPRKLNRVGRRGGGGGGGTFSG